MIVHLDFEASGTLDLRAVGADVWTRHPDTRVTFVGYAIDRDPVKAFCWPFKKWDDDIELLHAVLNGAEIHAWNAPFEWAVWNNIMTQQGGWPPLSIERFHCTMAAAANVGLPMGLDDASQAVCAAHTKDKTGHALMKRMARPRTFEQLLGHHSLTPRWWHNESPDKIAALLAYNVGDVEAERDIAHLVPRMTKRERAIWLVDQRMNQRGLPVDMTLLAALRKITDQEMARLNEAIRRTTNGVVTSVTQNARLLRWLKSVDGNASSVESLSKDTLAEVFDNFERGSPAREALAARIEAAKTSTAKLRSIEAFAQHDGRARSLVQYAGAIRTLRWAGRGPQIQNFPRPMRGLDVNGAIEQILLGLDATGIGILYGKPLDVVSSCLRGLFKAPSGFKLVICDYHAIEAVVLAWLAGFKELLDVFRKGEDVYVFTANAIGSTDRQLGKVLRLACGYGMGPDKFGVTAAKSGILLSLTQQHDAVQGFRQTNRPIVSLWYAYEAAAMSAISNPGRVFPVGKVEFRMADPGKAAKGSLLVKKPAGGHLVYRDARVVDGRITYQGVNQYTRQFTTLDTYGGKLVENVTQAVARDLLADAMVEFDALYPDALLTTIHDELVALTTTADAAGAFSGLKTIMSSPPLWAAGMPLSAAGVIADRYGKA